MVSLSACGEERSPLSSSSPAIAQTQPVPELEDVTAISAASLPPIYLEEQGQTFEDRAQLLLEYHATHAPNRSPVDDPTGYAKSGVYTAMARYAVGDIDGGNAMADEIFTNPASSAMFLTMAGMDLYMRYKEHMPEALQEKVKRFITTRNKGNYTGGSTENHGIMFAAGGYLAAQEWPDWDLADTVRQQTQEHIYKGIENISIHGLTEHDSPTYHIFFTNSLLSLYDHADDPEMRQRALVGLELLLTSMAPEWLEGYWASSTLRSYDFTHDPHIGSLSGPLGWLYWGGGPMPPREDGVVIMSAVSDYRIPEVLRAIGQDRRHPFVHRETQGTEFNRQDKYRKYTYMDRAYAMFSQFDGNDQLAWHDQMQRMGLVWISPEPGATFLMKHPVKGRRGDTKDGQVVQHERALVGVYKDTITGYLPDTEAVIDQFESDGWLFVHGGSVLFAVNIIQGFEWGDEEVVKGTPFKQLHSPHDRNGVVIQTAPVETFSALDQQKTDASNQPRAVLERFADAIKTQTTVEHDGITNVGLGNRNPKVRFTTLEGDVLELEFNQDRLINNVANDYQAWPLFENPWMKSSPGDYLTLTYGDRVRHYDFQTWTIEDAVEPNVSFAP